MDHKPNDGNPVVHRRPLTDPETSAFDLESQQLDFERYIIDTNSDSYTSLDECSLDESFQQIKNDLEQLHYASPRKLTGYRLPTAALRDDDPFVAVDDELPDIDINERFDVMKNRVRNYRAKETETLRQYIIELNNLTRISNEGMVKKCERLEHDITKQEKIQLLKTDIAAIRSRLLSFARNERLDSNVQNKNELQALIHTAKTELSNLEIYWNGRNIVSITEELNRHFDELNDPDTVLNHMNKEVSDLYSIYANARQRLESEISRYQSAFNTWVECDKQLMELEMKFKGFGDDGGIIGNQRTGGFGSASDSGMSDSGSEHELNEHEKRLVNLKQLANNLMSILTPGSEALSSILARIESNEKQLKELQQTCKDIIGRTEIHSDENKVDGNESIVETKAVDSTDAEETKTPHKKINSALLWRTLRIAVPFYLAVMILCSIGWLEPQCCDLQNNYKWSFALGLRYLNGPPPT